jgi:hypothetical protein
MSAGRIDSQAPQGVYMVAFDTTVAGPLVGVKITIEPCTLDLDESTRIDLSCHPLYAHLRAYCMSNPAQKG